MSLCGGTPKPSMPMPPSCLWSRRWSCLSSRRWSWSLLWLRQSMSLAGRYLHLERQPTTRQERAMQHPQSTRALDSSDALLSLDLARRPGFGHHRPKLAGEQPSDRKRAASGAEGSFRNTGPAHGPVPRYYLENSQSADNRVRRLTSELDDRIDRDPPWSRNIGLGRLRYRLPRQLFPAPPAAARTAQ